MSCARRRSLSPPRSNKRGRSALPRPGPVALPLAEARAALPVDNDYSLEANFAGMEWKRLRVQRDQQPPEWDGMNLSC